MRTAIDGWRKKLLDLTKRNRALNYRPSPVANVTLSGELPAEVFRTLYLEECRMTFRAAPDAPSAAAVRRQAADDEGVGDEQDAVADGDDFVPYDPLDLEDAHTDAELQTTLSGAKLDRSLRRLDELARASLEEQGVNTLFLALGMLRYTESESSEVEFMAPLVLLPVALTRTSARSGYAIRAAEDEPMVNPALAEHLRRLHSVQLPELPGADAMGETFDLNAVLTEIARLAQQKKGWAVKSTCALAQFSFQKFAMYKDLEANQAHIAAHRLLRALASREPSAAGPAAALPDDVRALDLDRDFAPESTHQVVDADSSQLRAVAAAARRHDLVIEGPPGTGKSQTITNLIAQALAAGRSVLFVAEKMAALGVVHSRLKAAGLGEFCLELHSTKANKREVLSELKSALDLSLSSAPTPGTAGQALPPARLALKQYVDAVHTPLGSMGTTPFEAYGRLAGYLTAPRVAYDGSTRTGVEPSDVDAAARALREFAATQPAVGDPREHPWRDAVRAFYSEDEIAAAGGTAAALIERMRELIARAAAAEETLGVPPVRRFADVAVARSVATVLSRSPGAPDAVLESSAWNSPPPEATALVRRGRELAQLERRALESVTEATFEDDHAADAAFVERRASGFLGFFAVFDGRYRAVRRRWLGLRAAGFCGSMLEQVPVMRLAGTIRAERLALDEAPGARDLFGALWTGWRSDWAALDAYIQWVAEFRQACVRHGLSARARAVAGRRQPDTAAFESLSLASDAARSAAAALCAAVGWPAGYLETLPFEEGAARAEALLSRLSDAPKWAAFESARGVAAATLGAAAAAAAMRGEIQFADMERAFLRSFWVAWTTDAVRARPALERFHSATHENRIDDFRRLDRMVLMDNRARLVAMLRERTQKTLREAEPERGMVHLRNQFGKQRGLAPLRTTLGKSGPAVRAIKPCMLMSPLTVAQLLPGGAPSFDLVIFDEASQLPPEDSVGTIFRGRQLIVVGDPKQLPPTDFFAVTAGDAAAPAGDDGEPAVEDAESVLEQFIGAGLPHCRLKWHYRSAHESLITFSNRRFYDGDLRTFPGVLRDAGLEFEHVAGAVYEGKGQNPTEARRVADEVMRFAREELARRDAGEEPRTLGVGTFNQRQQVLILDELEHRRRADLSAERFFDRGAAEPFFVKNLENIQGDERDVIFLSVTYGRSPDGRLRHQFGPLNGQNGWRRLNVIASRARQRMRVFSSFRGDEISGADTTARGAELLRSFLLYAERRVLDVGGVGGGDRAAESPFEADVIGELERRGVRVVPQVGEGGYRIDIGVVDDDAPDTFVCGVECDGAAYHSSETARDRDRLRQEVLEARGWTIHRVWSTDWFKDRAHQVERLLGLITDSRRLAKDAAESARVARAAAQRRAEEMEVELRRLAADDARGVAELPPYVRPTASAYSVTQWSGAAPARELLAEPLSALVRAVVDVVRCEGPIHVEQLEARVAAKWSTRVGSRVSATIRAAVGGAQLAGDIHQEAQFLRAPGAPCAVRSRAGMRVPAEHIAPEEYEAAISAVLAAGHGFARPALVNEVRAVLGFARTGAALDESIGSVLDAMLADGRIGEGGSGIRLRRSGQVGSGS